MLNPKLINFTYSRAGLESFGGYFPIRSKSQMLVFIMKKYFLYVCLFKHAVHALGKCNIRNRKIHVLRNFSGLRVSNTKDIFTELQVGTIYSAIA